MTWLFSKALMQDYENSRCSQGQEAESSVVTCSDGEPYAQLNVMPTPHKFWRNDKMMDASDLSRFGLTLRLLTDGHGEAVLMSYLAAFPARTSVQQERGQESTENEADYGGKCAGLFARYNPITSMWKTAQCSLVEGLDEFSETWPRWGFMRNGECWALDMSGALTCVSESGLWHPTPTKSDFKGANLRGEKQRESQLKEWLHVRYSQGLKTTYPHPSFLERVMAWPEGWTELQPLEMVKFQQWQQQHGGFLADEPHQ